MNREYNIFANDYTGPGNVYNPGLVLFTVMDGNCCRNGCKVKRAALFLNLACLWQGLPRRAKGGTSFIKVDSSF
uniref:Uncharacterized protein n=1 Tax=Marseillevirus LCMAC202 TaxID=2506606 RepID=A0A481YY25_9VIRU|nr:MAG: hypothetical protein LCMAC202_03910 [Marseillevirus LCMAC202]